MSITNLKRQIWRLAQRITKPIKVKRIQQGKMMYAGKYEIASNFIECKKEEILELLKETKTSQFIVMARYNNMIESMVDEYLLNKIKTI